MLLAIPVLPMASRTASAAEYTLVGDQVISDAQVLSGDTITLSRGNLTITPTGSLTVRGVTLIMDGNVTGRYHIEVQEGGTLIASGSTVKSVSNAYRYQFWVRPNSTFQMDSCVVNDCGWLNAPSFEGNGLYIQSSFARVTNSTLSNNCGGVIVDSGSSPFIYKNTISSNDWSGVAALNGSSPLVDNNIVQGNLRSCAGVAFAGGLVSRDASPVFSNNTVTANKDLGREAWTVGIALLAGGAPKLLYNTVSGHFNNNPANWGWGIYNSGPTGTYLKGCTVTNNGNGLYAQAGRIGMDDCVISRNLQTGDTSGGYSYADFTTSLVNNTVFNGGKDGILSLDTSATVFNRCTITNNTLGGLVGDGFQAPFGPILQNCTLSGNAKDIKFTRVEGGNQGGIATLINTSFTNTSVEILDDLAQLIVKWHMHIKVTYESTGAPAAGASIKCKDKQGGTQLLLLSESDGWSPWMVLHEKTMGNKSEYNVSLSPYNVSVSKGNAFNWTVIKLDQSYEFTFPLDDIVPWLKVDGPLDNDVINRTTVTFTGSVETPYVAVSAGGVGASVDEQGSWSARVPLPVEGKNTIIVSARDRGNNYFNQTVTLVRDTTAPVITLTSPGDNTLTNKTYATVSGKVSDISGHTFVGGNEVPVAADGTFTTQLLLDEGMNTIRVESFDAVWNLATETLRVELDTHAPALDVSEPADGFATNASSVTVKGTADAGSVVTVNGKQVPLTGERFSATVTVVEGDNTVEVVALDPAGNPRIKTLTVRRDSTPPRLTMTFPQDGAVLRDPLVTVRGSTEEGALVKVNGGGVSYDGRTFYSEVRLTTEGENLITIDVYDALKNHVRTVIRVFLDTVAPELRMTMPAQNFLTSASEFELRGRTEPAANVTVDGEEVVVDGNGIFSVRLPLPTDGTYTFEIISTDIAGNSAEEYHTVTRDTVVYFNVSSPVNGLKTRQKALSVTGDVEPGATVSVNGATVTPRQDGTFIAEVILSDGQNTIIVQVRDKAGNLQAKELTVTKTKPEPPSSGTPGFDALVVAAALGAVAVVAARRARGKR